MSKSKYDNDFKSEVIEKGLLKEIVLNKKRLYHDNKEKVISEEGVIYSIVNNNDWFEYLIDCKRDKAKDCALLLMESKRHKMYKVREKISDIVLKDNAVFITLTFRDEVFEKTTPQTRRRYVARFLKEQCCDYVANIDFSPDIKREHYHAVIGSRVNLKAWKYGFSYAEKVRCHNNDLKRVSKYITKLTAHALKIDATRLIYSRS